MDSLIDDTYMTQRLLKRERVDDNVREGIALIGFRTLDCFRQ